MTTIPETMRAIVLTGHGDLDMLVYHEDCPTPQPAANEVLIKVHACGMNNTDVNTRSGWYSKAVTDATTGGAYETVDDEDPTWGGAPLTFPRIQGADAVGTVVATGAEADASLVGKRVLIDTWVRDWNEPMNMNKTGYFGSECDGGFADYTKADHRNIHPIESDLSHAELATFATSWSTAEQMLNRASVTTGDTVLITGASGGVGSALIQLANRRGAKTIAMASASKHEDLRSANPTAILDRAPDNLAAALKAAIGADTVSVVADVVGGEAFPAIIDVLERGGRYVCSGAIAGPLVELDLRTFYLRDLSFFGSTILPPGVFGDLVGYIARGEVKPMLAETYALKDFHAGQQTFIDKKHVGNIVVTMD